MATHKKYPDELRERAVKKCSGVMPGGISTEPSGSPSASTSRNPLDVPSTTPLFSRSATQPVLAAYFRERSVPSGR
jgi:hypothetical protein